MQECAKNGDSPGAKTVDTKSPPEQKSPQAELIKLRSDNENESKNTTLTPRRKPGELNMYLIEHTFLPFSPNSDMIPANSQPIIPLLSLTPNNAEGGRQTDNPFFSSPHLHPGSPFLMASNYMNLASTPTLLSSFTNALKGQHDQGTN